MRMSFQRSLRLCSQLRELRLAVASWNAALFPVPTSLDLGNCLAGTGRCHFEAYAASEDSVCESVLMYHAQL